MNNEQIEYSDGLLPGAVPTEPQVGTYQSQFESIRQLVCSELQAAGAEYTMSVQKLVRTCLNANLELSNIAEQHCNNILQRFRACKAKLVNHTNVNAMYDIDGKLLLVDFDLSKHDHSVLSAKFMQPSVFDCQLAVTSELLLLRQLQCLLTEHVNDNIAVSWQQCMNSVSMAKRQLERSREILRTTIESRAFTAFNFEPGISFYTLNFSDDMSMLFWDRYTITECTAKSYYVEQHCIVEHTITGDIEEERFITLHKPSKNSMAQFFADRLVCLTDMVRPIPNVKSESVVPVQVVNAEDDEDDEFFTDEELIEQGFTEAEIEEYHQTHVK